MRGRIEARKEFTKVLTSVTATSENFPWTSSAKAPGQRRAAALLHGKRRKVKLWEEPDQKLVTDDVRGGGCSFWAEWHYAAARTPAVLQPLHFS